MSKILEPVFSDDRFVFISEDNVLSVTLDRSAVQYLSQAVTEPFLLVGIKKGGCSGSRYDIEEIHACDLSQYYAFALSSNLTLIVPHKDGQEFAALKCIAKDAPRVLTLQWTHKTQGPVCGCGESFGS